MKKRFRLISSLLGVVGAWALAWGASNEPRLAAGEVWNAGAPRIRGPRVYGATPGREFLYSFPTAGDRNGMVFSVAKGALPGGARLDSKTGVLSGRVAAAGTYAFTVRADNGRGVSERDFRLIVATNALCQTPPMGWTSWNAFTDDIDQDLIADTARAIVRKGLAAHGYAFVNIDSCWQGQRNAKDTMALQANELFPDMGALVSQIHALGLKAGIYSTPMVHAHGSSDRRLLPGSTGYPLDARFFHKKFGGCGQKGFEKEDAAQFARWGFDWLKYDWNRTEIHHSQIMREALDLTPRDIVLQVCTGCHSDDAAEYAKCVQLARGIGDTEDTWARCNMNVRRFGGWLKHIRPGFWCDLDMLAVGMMRIGRKGRAIRSTRAGETPDPRLGNRLTPDELESQFAWWAILPAPLFLSCDIIHIDDFTLKLVTNDDLIEINQDWPAKPAKFVDFGDGKRCCWVRELSDGRIAYGYFNLGDDDWTARHSLPRVRLTRDVMAGRDLGSVCELSFALKPHACRILLCK